MTENRDDGPPAQEPNVSSTAASLDTGLGTGERAAPASMDAFLAQVERRAWRMAEFALRDREEALDAVQDAMLRLVKSYRHKPAEEWTPLFWSILRRRITDLQRRRKVRSIVVGWLGGGHDNRGEELPTWEPADDAPDPQHALEDKQAYAAMNKGVTDLPTRQREAFMLRVLEGLSVADTASAMGCSEGSVKTHLSRAMHTLRDQLEEWR